MSDFRSRYEAVLTCDEEGVAFSDDVAVYLAEIARDSREAAAIATRLIAYVDLRGEPITMQLASMVAPNVVPRLRPN